MVQHVSTLAEGAVFGEISLLFDVAVSATVGAASACTVLRLSREQFEALVLSHPDARKMLLKLGEQRKKDLQTRVSEPVAGLQASW